LTYEEKTKGYAGDRAADGILRSVFRSDFSYPHHECQDHFGRLYAASERSDAVYPSWRGAAAEFFSYIKNPPQPLSEEAVKKLRQKRKMLALVIGIFLVAILLFFTLAL
jgi:hypothetical protein